MTRSKKGGKYTSKDTSKDPGIKSLFDEFAEELKDRSASNLRPHSCQTNSKKFTIYIKVQRYGMLSLVQ